MAVVYGTGRNLDAVIVVRLKFVDIFKANLAKKQNKN